MGRAAFYRDMSHPSNPSVGASGPRIAVIKFRHIGDVLLVTPALHALREWYPTAFLTAIIPADTEAMLTGLPVLDQVIPVDLPNLRRQRGWRRIQMELAILRHIRKQRFDITIDLTSGDRAALLSWYSGARIRVAADPFGAGFFGKKYFYTHRRPLKTTDTHMVEQNLDVIRQIKPPAAAPQKLAFGVPTDALETATHWPLRIAISDADHQSVAPFFTTKNTTLHIHLHPTSRWLFKCWPEASVAKLGDRIVQQYGAKILLTCGPDVAEVDKARRIVGLMRYRPVDRIGKTTLKQVAAIAARCHLFIGVDSAPMHIAAAVGTPVVALFGPSKEHWRPWGKGHTVIAKPMLCRPCDRAGCNDSKRSACLESLTVDEVWQAVEQRLAPIARLLSP